MAIVFCGVDMALGGDFAPDLREGQVGACELGAVWGKNPRVGRVSVAR